MCEDKTEGMSRPGTAVSRSGLGGWDMLEVSTRSSDGLSLSTSPLSDIICVVCAEQKDPRGV